MAHCCRCARRGVAHVGRFGRGATPAHQQRPNFVPCREGIIRMTDERRPNIVMILTDDHAAHSIGAYGSVVNETPRIDEIAQRGVLFENCFATNALCSPSRASILTGTYSHVNGVTTLVTPIDASQPTFVTE